MNFTSKFLCSLVNQKPREAKPNGNKNWVTNNKTAGYCTREKDHQWIVAGKWLKLGAVIYYYHKLWEKKSQVPLPKGTNDQGWKVTKASSLYARAFVLLTVSPWTTRRRSSYSPRSSTSLHSQVAAVEVLLSNWMPCLYRGPFAFLYFLYQIHLMKALTVVTHYCWQWYRNHGSPVGNMLRDGIAHS